MCKHYATEAQGGNPACLLGHASSFYFSIDFHAHCLFSLCPALQASQDCMVVICISPGVCVKFLCIAAKALSEEQSNVVNICTHFAMQVR